MGMLKGKLKYPKNKSHTPKAPKVGPEGFEPSTKRL
jgi:hypothetical protein